MILHCLDLNMQLNRTKYNNNDYGQVKACHRS